MSWDKSHPSTSRFSILSEFNNEAVRDNNTGLVWEQTPANSSLNWATAASYCVNKVVGGTRGWRLPSIVELVSLIDPSLPAPFVPTSVFTNVQLANYWSATTRGNSPSDAWGVNFKFGNVIDAMGKTGNSLVWCVRGPMQESTY